jgi:hypothetical protein
VDDATIRARAEAMVSSGMRDAGYTSINIVDTWEGERDGNGIIPFQQQISRHEGTRRHFVHSSLKIGIYSSPGRRPAPNTKAATAMNGRVRRPMRPGGSTISSTISADCATK